MKPRAGVSPSWIVRDTSQHNIQPVFEIPNPSASLSNVCLYFSLNGDRKSIGVLISPGATNANPITKCLSNIELEFVGNLS